MLYEPPSWLVQLTSFEELLKGALVITLIVLWVGMIAFFVPVADVIARAQRRNEARKRPFLDPTWPACDCQHYRKDMEWCFETIHGEDLYACPECPRQEHRSEGRITPSRFPFLTGREGGQEGITLPSGMVIMPFAQQEEGLVILADVGTRTVPWEEIVPKWLPKGDLTTWVAGGIKESA